MQHGQTTNQLNYLAITQCVSYKKVITCASELFPPSTFFLLQSAQRSSDKKKHFRTFSSSASTIRSCCCLCFPLSSFRCSPHCGPVKSNIKLSNFFAFVHKGGGRRERGVKVFYVFRDVRVRVCVNQTGCVLERRREQQQQQGNRHKCPENMGAKKLHKNDVRGRGEVAKTPCGV